MGGRTGDFLSGRTKEQQAARKADFAQAQKQYDSRKRFGQTSTRAGGLTAEQIGEAPVMEDPLDIYKRQPSRRAGGFGGSSTLG